MNNLLYKTTVRKIYAKTEVFAMQMVKSNIASVLKDSPETYAN
jgi:hypothetical protein